MKPFNLEKFLAGEPAITRNGKKVIEGHYFKDAEDGHRLWVMLEDDVWPINYFDNGSGGLGGLLMEEKEIELWINIYSDRKGKYFALTYDSEYEAKLNVETTYMTFMGTQKIII